MHNQQDWEENMLPAWECILVFKGVGWLFLWFGVERLQ
jgi:hypothetical protein